MFLKMFRLLFGADRAKLVEQRMEEYRESREREEATVEEADWLGKTGLPESLERELPRYLRREFGELMEDEGSLKAADLKYIGIFTEGSEAVHYWRVPSRGTEEIYAYIAISPDGESSTGVGGKKPPTRA